MCWVMCPGAEGVSNINETFFTLRPPPSGRPDGLSALLDSVLVEQDVLEFGKVRGELLDLPPDHQHLISRALQVRVLRPARGTRLD